MPRSLVKAAASLAAAALAAVACAATAAAAPCQTSLGPVATGTAQWNGWGRDPDNSRYQPEPALRVADIPRLAVKWAYGYAGADDAGAPSVVDGRLFVGDSAGRVHALDARSGCGYWMYEAGAPVGAAITIGELAASRLLRTPQIFRRKKVRTDAHIEVVKAPSAAFFSDATGTVYALDAEAGGLLWKTAADAGVHAVGTPVVHARALYAAATGQIFALDLWTGRLLWKTAVEARSGATIDASRGLLYAGAADGIVALELADGRVRWQKHVPAGAGVPPCADPAQPAGRKQLLLAPDSAGTVHAFDPAHDGEVLWQARIAPERSDVRIEWGAAADHRNVYVGTAAAGMAALDIASGRLRWSAPMPQAPTHAVTVIPGALFAGARDGHLRAFRRSAAASCGTSTRRAPTTPSTISAASGGTPGAGGVVVVKGMVYINSWSPPCSRFRSTASSMNP